MGMVLLANLTGSTSMPDWTEAEEALNLLEKDPAAFLAAYLLKTPGTAEKGIFSVTSR